jgi:hypothetical protein
LSDNSRHRSAGLRARSRWLAAGRWPVGAEGVCAPAIHRKLNEHWRYARVVPRVCPNRCSREGHNLLARRRSASWGLRPPARWASRMEGGLAVEISNRTIELLLVASPRMSAAAATRVTGDARFRITPTLDTSAAYPPPLSVPQTGTFPIQRAQLASAPKGVGSAI